MLFSSKGLFFSLFTSSAFCLWIRLILSLQLVISPYQVMALQSSQVMGEVESSPSVGNLTASSNLDETIDAFTQLVAEIDEASALLFEKTQQAVNRHLYLKLPGFNGQPVTAADVAALEEQYKAQQRKLQRLFDQGLWFDSQSEEGHSIVLVWLVSYFLGLNSLLNLKFSAGTPFSLEQWQNQTSLLIDLQKVADESFLLGLSQFNTLRGEASVPFYASPPKGPARPGLLQLKVKSWLAHDIYQLYLAQRDSSNATLLTSQFVTTNILYDNLVHFWRLQDKSISSLPDLPSPLTQVFPTLAHKRMEKVEEWNWLVTEQIKENWLSHITALTSEIRRHKQSFLDEEFMLNLLFIDNPEQASLLFGDEPEIVESLQILRDIEEAGFIRYFRVLLPLWPVNPHADQSRQKHNLLAAIAEASAMSLRNLLLSDNSLTESVRNEKLRLIENQKAAYIQKLEKLNTPQWNTPLQSATQFDFKFYQAKLRREYLGRLKEGALAISGFEKLSSAEQDRWPVRYDFAFSSLREEFLKAGIHSSSLELMAPLFQAPSYALIQDGFHKTLASMLANVSSPSPSPQIDERGQVDPQALLSWLEKAQVSADHLEKSQNPALKEIVKNSQGALIQTLQDVVHIGQRFHFFNSGRAPTLSELNLSESSLKAYKEFLKNQSLSQYPVLDLLVPTSTRNSQVRGRVGNTPSPTRKLWQVLVSQNDQSNAWVNLIAAQTEKTQKNLQFMAAQFHPGTYADEMLNTHYLPSSQATKDFRRLMIESTLIANHLKAHPSLSATYSDFVTETLTPSMASQLWHAVYNNAELGLAVLIAYQLFRWVIKYRIPLKLGFIRQIGGFSRASSFLRQLEHQVLGPYLSPFLIGTMAAIGYQQLIAEPIAVYTETATLDELTNDFYISNPEGDGFFSWSQKEQAHDNFLNQQAAIAIQAGLLVGLLGGLVFLLPKVKFWQGSSRTNKVKKNLSGALEELELVSKEIPEAQLSKYTFIESNIEARKDALIQAVNNSTLPFSEKISKITKIRQAAERIERWIAQEEQRWALLGQRLSSQFQSLGLKPGQWNLAAINEAFNTQQRLYTEKAISAESFHLVKVAYSEIMGHIVPIYQRFSDPMIKAFYIRVWGLEERVAADSEWLMSRFEGEWSAEFIQKSTSDVRFDVETVEAAIDGKTVTAQVLTPKWQKPIMPSSSGRPDIIDLEIQEELTGGADELIHRYAQALKAQADKEAYQAMTKVDRWIARLRLLKKRANL